MYVMPNECKIKERGIGEVGRDGKGGRGMVEAEIYADMKGK